MKLVVSMLLVVLFVGCKTTSGNYKKESQYNNEYIENSILEQQGSQSVIDSILHNYRAKVKGVYRVYGDPDSTGTRQILSENDYTVELEGNKQAVSKQDNQNNTKLVSDKKNTGHATLDESGRNETDNRIFRPPEWIYYVLSLILLLFIIYKLKNVFRS